MHTDWIFENYIEKFFFLVFYLGGIVLLCLYLKSKVNNKIIQIKCYDIGNLISNNMELWLGIQYKTDNELTIFKTG